MIFSDQSRAVEFAVPALAVILAAVSVMTAAADDRTVLVAAGPAAVAGTIVALVLGWSALAWLAIALLGGCLAVPSRDLRVAPLGICSLRHRLVSSTRSLSPPQDRALRDESARGPH